MKVDWHDGRDRQNVYMYNARNAKPRRQKQQEQRDDWKHGRDKMTVVVEKITVSR